jgi:hypothetical protein
MILGYREKRGPILAEGDQVERLPQTRNRLSGGDGVRCDFGDLILIIVSAWAGQLM